LPDCNAAGSPRYICGLAGPEDLATVPQTKWLIASAMQGEGGLYLIDTTQATASRIFPAPGAERFDRKEYGACPGPLSATQAVTHGLYLKPGRRSVHTLYAVHHGDRESIEVFEVDAKSTPPAVTWIGCVVVPDPVGINSVAALPDGGFVLTNFDPRTPPPPGGASARDARGDSHPRNDGLNTTLTQWLTKPANEDALLVWLFGLTIEARVLPDQLGYLRANADFALTFALATNLDMALLLAVDLIEVIKGEPCEFAEAQAGVSH
jgi:hypothetical protein